MSLLLRPLAPFVRGDTYRALLYYVASLVLGVVGFAAVIVGWTLTCVFAITPLVVPILIAFRAVVGSLALAQASLARDLLGTNTRPAALTGGDGFWNRGLNVLRDRAFWRQQLHLLVSWPVALGPLCLLSLAGEMFALPLYYDAAEQDIFGAHIDQFSEAILFVPLGLALVLVTVHLLGPIARVSRWLASRLLADEDSRPTRSRVEIRAQRLRALTIHSLIATSIALANVVIWALTGGGYFWPIWGLIALDLVVGIPGLIILVLEHPTPARLTGGSKALAIQIGVSVLVFGFLVAVWAITTGGYFWPIWPALGLAVLAAFHAAVVYARRQHRIEMLETTRAGAVDAQEAELRRIERDLHDGAQARLVALGMSLGQAEQKLETDPEAVRELLAEARQGAGEALVELRSLARGIHPPILTDRGLEAAVTALSSRSPWPVTVTVDVPKRPPSAVETAAYFVVAEALANVTKHARATSVDVRIHTAGGTLVAEVVDDGKGGADVSGNGLTGLRQRVEALDGSLRVTSPVGGPTTVRAELPCGS
jgi:signal transduction histidine kinase